MDAIIQIILFKINVTVGFYHPSANDDDLDGEMSVR
jgi:hypothetical protein